MATRMLPGFGLANLNQAIGVLPVVQGGTGATTAAGARANLGISDPGPLEAVAGEALAVGNVIYLDSSGGGTAGYAFKADANVIDISTTSVAGVVITGGGIGDTIEYLSAGLVATSFVSAPAASNNGKPVWLSDSAGFASMTASSDAVWRIGILKGADGGSTTPEVQLDFDPIMQ